VITRAMNRKRESVLKGARKGLAERYAKRPRERRAALLIPDIPRTIGDHTECDPSDLATLCTECALIFVETCDAATAGEA